MKILVTGGAGYIGSFMTKRLIDEGMNVVVVDSLERGHQNVVTNEAVFKQGDLKNEAFVRSLLADYQFDGVIHFAGFISMGESMKNPSLYFQNNTFATLNLLEAMRITNTRNIIFSSTAGVYGNPTTIPIPEDHKKYPTNPYGESKLMVEQMLRWYEEIFGVHYTALRYFNACGASLDGRMGENHDPESHIIPLAMKALLTDSEFSLFGTDYNTPDGTCIRDYIHVLDLVEAHVLALKKLHNEPGGYVYNVGTGIGYSNKQVLEKIEEVTGKKMNIREEQRREGDADQLIADASKIKQDTGFSPKYSDLDTIVKTAWEWHKKQANQS